MESPPKNPLSVNAALGNQDLAYEQQGLLDLIDKIQFAQLDNVKLPQIVVVGDQSAGKSSVLEAITGMPFLRDAGACTRFATEIRLRRAKEESFTVQILPDKDRPYNEQARLRQFGGAVDESTSFEKLIRDAVDEIAPKKVGGKFAAKDVLVVAKSGPKMPLLTVVDLPGLVRIANNDQSKEDIDGIEYLTDRYMRSSRTIILAVIGGNHDYVQAPILEKAREFDPTGARTIGVLTKPDLLEFSGWEDRFIALVNNQDKKNEFRLGWFVLRNPGPREPGQEWPSQQQRRQGEYEFFTRPKWSDLPSTMCGADALKHKISVQLQRHIGKHMKTLRKEIQQALDDCEVELKSLGSGKDTVEEMRDELVELFEYSQALVIQAVDGTYQNPPAKSFFPVRPDPRGTPAQTLRARVVEENKRFAEKVRTHGHRVNLISEGGSGGAKLKGRESMTKEEYAKKEVEPLLKQNIGTHFPMDHELRLVYKLFKAYSSEWSVLALAHRNSLGAICDEFLNELIDSEWPRRMEEKLRTQFLDPQTKQMLEKARKEVDSLLHDKDYEVPPYDPEYEERMNNWNAAHPKDRSYTEAEVFLEKMLIYYDLSSKIFITNVITQVVERHLLRGLRGIFNSLKITRMEEAAVVAIATENETIRNQRLELKAKRTAIEEALDICASLSMRRELRTYGEDEPDDVEDSSLEEQPSKPLPRKQRPSADLSSNATETPQPQSRGTKEKRGPSAGHSSSATETPQPQSKGEKDEQRTSAGLSNSASETTQPPSEGKKGKQRATPVNTEDKTNGNGSDAPVSGPKIEIEEPVVAKPSFASAGLPRTPGGWTDASTTNRAPQYAPPAPPPADTDRHEMDGKNYQPPQKSSGSGIHATPNPPVQGQHYVQPIPPVGANSNNRYPGAYPQSDRYAAAPQGVETNGRPDYSPQLPTDKRKHVIDRKLFGQRS